MIQIQPTDLIIAPPSMPDPRFKQTVLMILSDNESGTVALCLNRPLDLETSDLIELNDSDDIMTMSHPIYWGGPMGQESIWMLHDDEWCSDNTMEVGPGIRVSSDREMLDALKEGDCPSSFRLVSGFASWAPGQLQAELDGRGNRNRSHAWLVAPTTDLEWLLELPVEEIWEHATALCAQTAVDSWLN
jgi:putative transcriptional regulator